MLRSLINNVRFIWGHPLNADAKVAAIARFLRLQLAARIGGKPLLVDWIEPLKFVFTNGESGITQNAYCGLHEHVEMLFLLHLLQEGDHFVDIGANVGSYSMLAAGVRNATVIAIEPVPSTFAKLNLNLRINNLQSRVESKQIGVAARDGTARFTVDKNCTNHIVDEDQETADSIEISTETLDGICGKKIPTLIKIDVEGFETEVINGGEQTLRSPELLAVIMELNESGNRYGYDESSLVARMIDFGFETASYDPFTREITSLNGKCLTSGNTLFIRNKDEIQSRIEQASKIKIDSQQL